MINKKSSHHWRNKYQNSYILDRYKIIALLLEDEKAERYTKTKINVHFFIQKYI